jgi:hypothetical protein
MARRCRPRNDAATLVTDPYPGRVTRVVRLPAPRFPGRGQRADLPPLTKYGLALFLATSAVTLTACGSEGPSLTLPNMIAGATEGAARVHQGDTVSIGQLVACLNKPGTVRVLSMSAVDPVGLKVTGWGLRQNTGNQIAVGRGDLAFLGVPTDVHKIGPASTCKKGTPQATEFVVQVTKTTRGEAGATAWRVTYVSDGQTKTFTWPLTVVLCNETSSDSKKCDALKL